MSELARVEERVGGGRLQALGEGGGLERNIEADQAGALEVAELNLRVARERIDRDGGLDQQSPLRPKQRGVAVGAGAEWPGMAHLERPRLFGPECGVGHDRDPKRGRGYVAFRQRGRAKAPTSRQAPRALARRDEKSGPWAHHGRDAAAVDREEVHPGADRESVEPEAALAFAVRGVLALRVYAEDVPGYVGQGRLATNGRDLVWCWPNDAAELHTKRVRDRAVVAAGLEVGEVGAQP